MAEQEAVPARKGSHAKECRGPQKPEKARERVLSEGTSPADTLTLAQSDSEF